MLISNRKEEKPLVSLGQVWQRDIQSIRLSGDTIKIPCCVSHLDPAKSKLSPLRLCDRLPVEFYTS